jgi:hypothetical protein
MGPAATLLFNANSFNKEELDEVTKLLKANFVKLANFKPTGRKEFCAQILQAQASGTTVSKIDMINTKFFQTMTSKEAPSCHADVERDLAPLALEMSMRNIPGSSISDNEKEAVTKWIAAFEESYLSEDELNSTLNALKADKSDPEINKKRGEIGMKLYQKIQSKEFTKEHFVALTGLLGLVMDKNLLKDNSDVMTLFREYLDLFQMSNRPELLGGDVLSKLNGPFKQKFFPEA